MLNGPNYITYFPTSILGIAGYYTDYDGWQHVIAAADDGNVYQVTWDPPEVAPGYPPHPIDPLWHYNGGLQTIAGFFTPDDSYHHAVVGTQNPDTRDYELHEIWYKLAELPHTNTTVLPYHSRFEPKKGMAGFYSSCDNLRHVVVVDGNGNPVDITWKANQPLNSKTITIQPNISQVASISGFLSRDENPNTRHIIVARNDTGEIYDIDYPDKDHVPGDISGHDNVYVKTTFGERVKNVTAFFSSDTNYRHIVVLTQQNWLKDHAYDIHGINRPPIQLVHDANVVDMTSFYSAHDQLCHVLYVTKDSNLYNLYEITYTSQG